MSVGGNADVTLSVTDQAAKRGSSRKSRLPEDAREDDLNESTAGG
jgi:hypothetical protein